MDAFDPRAGGGPPVGATAAGGEAGGVEFGCDLPQPLGPLRVSLAGVVVKESRIGIKERHGT